MTSTSNLSFSVLARLLVHAQGGGGFLFERVDLDVYSPYSLHKYRHNHITNTVKQIHKY